MSLNINTNVAALTAHRSMMKTDNDMRTSLQRLSTGLRINSAADDASGMTIADSLKSQHMGLGQGIRNANDAVSIVQTADGALEESINIVNIIKTKAIQAASDGQTADTRSAIQADIDKLVEELNVIAKTTSYNGQQLLNGNFTNKHIQIGANSNETAKINIGATSANQTGHMSTAKLELNNKDGGEVQITMTSAITGEKVKLEALEILKNNKTENGMGALADKINAQKSQTGIGAVAVVESTTEKAVQEGTTGSDFAINGIKIGGAINVKAGDSDNALITAINKKTNETGVTASRESDGRLTLRSTDGRAIKVSGDTGSVFGDQKAADLSTVGYIKLTQSGSSQFDIEGTTAGGTKNAITLSNDLKTAGKSTLAAGSSIAKGSELKNGSVVGGNAVVNSTVTNALSDYQLKQGSSLAAGSTLSQGTVVGGNVIVSGNTEAGNQDTSQLKQDMKLTKGSVLSVGSVLGAGTVLTSDLTQGGTTYKAGQALTTNVTLTAELIVKDDMTLSKESAVAAGSTLATGSVMGTDIKIGSTWDASNTPGAALTGGPTASDALLTGATTTLGNAVTLAKGSTLKDGSTIELGAGAYSGPTLETNQGTIKSGDTLTAGTYTIKGDQTITDNLVTAVGGAVLAQNSVIAKGSTIGAASVATGNYETITRSTATMTEGMTLKAKSNLAGGSILATGSTLGNDTKIAGENGALRTHAETKLTAGSTLESGSKLAKGSVVDGNVQVTATTLENDMSLKAGSTLKQDTLLKQGTVVTQDMTLNTAAGGNNATKVAIKAGTVLTQDLYVHDADVTLSKDMTLAAKSQITAGSKLDINTKSAGNLDLNSQKSRTLADLSVMTQEDAQVAIDIADTALKDLDKTRSNLGSIQQQLTSSIANMSVTKTNIKASESAIRDVDFAEETANYSRLKLLSQTSSYALAQANSSTEKLLSLMK
ncbi:MAG: hypothetical protein MI863_23605 [Desulfobacterales bacterium]|nr:hypothetical protein [Desulfobacterales bacterium]